MREIKLMADYQCHPLWDMSPGKYGDIDPITLPISDDLRQELTSWARVFDETLNMLDPASSGFKTAVEEAAFRTQGLRLADRLKDELGPEFLISVKA